MSEPPALAGRRILVTEDDYLVALDLVDQLQALGAEIIGPCHNIAAAWEALAATSPDAAILDVKLGRELVYPLADRLLELRIPFIFATGFDASALPARFASCPRLTKPIAARDLKNALHAIVSQ